MSACTACGRRPVYALIPRRSWRWLWRRRGVCGFCAGLPTGRLTARQARAEAARLLWQERAR
jgi:hypothetical protein